MGIYRLPKNQQMIQGFPVGRLTALENRPSGGSQNLQQVTDVGRTIDIIDDSFAIQVRSSDGLLEKVDIGNGIAGAGFVNVFKADGDLGVNIEGDAVTVGDEAYGSGWNGSMEVPTKNALYDKIETLSGGTPAGSNGQLQYNDSGAFGGLDGSAVDDTNQRLGLQVSTPQMPLHVASVTGTTLNNVVTGSISLIDEVLPNIPTGSITAIPMPNAGSGGSASYVDSGTGTAITATGNSYDFRIYPCLYVSGLGVYYKSQNFETVSAGTDPNDSQGYNINVTWGTVSISGETIYYFVEYDINSSGSWSALGTYSSTNETFTALSGSDSTTAWPTFYTDTITPPTPYTGGSATPVNVGSGGLTEVSTNIYLEVDSIKNIGGTDYVSGSPTTGYFDDTGLGSYDAEITWTDNGNSANSVVRISQDGGSTWYYQFTGGTTPPYTFTSLSNDPVAEALWGQTYTSSGTAFEFTPYGTGLTPSSNVLYSSVGTQYGITISDSRYYILKHTFSGNFTGKVIDVATGTYGKQYIGGEFYDIGYMTWASGTTVTPTSYGFTGTAQNRDYKAYSSGTGIYSIVPLTLSVTSSGGSKSVSGSFTYPSGVSQVKITRQVNGGGYTVSKTFNSPTNTFTDDTGDTTWSGNTTVTPTSIIGGVGRFDKTLTTLSDEGQIAVVSTGSGTRYMKISFGIASDSSTPSTYQAYIYATSGTGYLTAVTSRLIIEGSLGGTASTILGASGNVINNNNGSSNHFTVKGQNDSSLFTTRADMDTAGFGQAIGSDQQTTVQIQPARSADAGLVMIGHGSQASTFAIFRTQTSGGTFGGDITIAGAFRGGADSVSNPSHSWRNDPNTGLQNVSADIMALVAGGVEQGRVTTTGTSVRLGVSGSLTKVGGTITSSTTAVGNVGTGEDNLISYTLPASSLATNLDRIIGRVSGTFASNANNKRIRLYFGTTVIFDTTALALNGGNWVADFEVIRVSATSQKANVSFYSSNALLPVSSKYTLVAMTLTSSQVIKCTGEATANNDVVQETLSIDYKPI
jgi:hypothetical protein